MYDKYQKHKDEDLRSKNLKTIGTMSTGIAHDLNNILTPILSFTTMAMIDPGLNDNVRYCINQIIKATNHAKELTSQIMSFSRGSAGIRKPLQLGAEVNENVKLLKAYLPDNIKIETSIDFSAGQTLANSCQILQLVMNLGSNACHAIGKETGIIKISLKKTAFIETDTDSFSKAKEFIQLSFKDTGCGIDDKTKMSMFESFYTTKTNGNGLGLGLFVVGEIVKNQNGKITVESELDKGSTFNIYFPALQPDAGKESTLQNVKNMGAAGI